MSALDSFREWWARRSTVGRVGTVAGGIFVVLAIPSALFSPSKSSDDSADTTSTQAAATQPTTDTSTTPPPPAKQKPQLKCLTKSMPVVCRIAEKELDIPLLALVTPDVSGGVGVSYSLGLPPHAHANEVVLAATEAQMSLAYSATVKELSGQDVAFVDAAAYINGDKAGTDSPAFSTSIGRAGIQRIVSGSDPIDVWRMDGISPLFTQAGIQP